MDTTYHKSQRRKARTALRNYFCAFREEICENFNIILPDKETIKQMSKLEFGKLINVCSKVIMKHQRRDLELTELLETYILLDNNIKYIEYSNSIIL